METFFLEHMADLSARAQAQNTFTFTGFLTAEEQSGLLSARRSLTHFELYGGAEGTERNMARFGSEEELGYSVPFPIVCLVFTPLNERFAEALTHRDYLGAIMHLGIERADVGDIVVRPPKAYVFCTERMAPYIMENLTRVRHTELTAALCEALPAGSLYETETFRLTVSSLRLDCVAGAALNLSRSRTAALIQEKKAFVNGVCCVKPDAPLGPGDVFSVRGYGKCRVGETPGQSKKGKTVLLLEKYK